MVWPYNMYVEYMYLYAWCSATNTQWTQLDKTEKTPPKDFDPMAPHTQRAIGHTHSSGTPRPFIVLAVGGAARHIQSCLQFAIVPVA
jgi:hypothetical protein